jgi:hypothetical protein
MNSKCTVARTTWNARPANCLSAMLGLLLLSCSGSPTSPLEIGQLSLGAAYDVFVNGGTAFVSNNDGVAILDIIDIRNPRRVATIQESSSGGAVAGFHVSNDTLFAYGANFSMYDLEDINDPRLFSRYSGRAFISGARKQGDYVYLSYMNGGLDVIDFRDPANPSSIGFASSAGQVNDLAIIGTFAFVANSSTGLEMFDIGNPAAPQRVGVVAGTAGAWDIHMDQQLLYLGCHRYGIKVLDISDPSAPTVLGSFDNGGETYGVFAVGTRLYSVDLVEGVEVLDVSSPENPTLIMADGNYHPHDLFSDGLHLFLADQDRHFVVLPLDLEESL